MKERPVRTLTHTQTNNNNKHTHTSSKRQNIAQMLLSPYKPYQTVALSPYLDKDRLLVSSQEVRPLEDIWEETATQWHPAQLPWYKEGDAEESQTTGGHQQGQQAHWYIWEKEDRERHSMNSEHSFFREKHWHR